jgi:hypothetical protein
MEYEAEQRFHDLEQRHIALRKEYETVSIDKEALKGEHVGD